MIEKTTADAKTAVKTERRQTLTMTLSDLAPTCWIPATEADRQTLWEIQNTTDRYPEMVEKIGVSGALLRVCAVARIKIVFDPDNSRFRDPPPCSGELRALKGRGGKSKTPKVPN